MCRSHGGESMDDEVSVREHGHARELRVGMVCASVQVVGTPITHGYWDALALPLLLMQGCPRPRCLMLGLGAGTGARWIRALCPAARIVAVEASLRVVEVARREFELDALDIDVRIGDGEAFLRDDREDYELIIEDIFVDRGGAAHKPVWLPSPGLEHAAARLAAGGVLVSNNLAEAEASAEELRRCLAHVLCVEVRDSDNRVYFASHTPLSALPAAVESHALLAPIAPNLSLRAL